MDAFKMNLPGLAIVVLATMPAASSVMNIWMKDGRKVEYDTAQISSISFTEGEAAGEGDSAAFTEDFRGGLSETWDSYGVVGGDFQRFARVESGRLVVRVPEGNSWAKTGIYSKEPFVTISESPVSVEVELDPKDTTGVCVAFSAAKDHDIWRQQTVWVTWAKVSETGGSAYFANTQNGSEHFGEIKTGPTAPRSSGWPSSTGTSPTWSPISAEVAEM